MGTLWDYGPKQFEVHGGAVDFLVKLRVPHRGTIQRINLEQIGGTDDGNFEIYDSYEAARVIAEYPAPVYAVNSFSSSLSSNVSSSLSSGNVEGGDPAAHSVTQGLIDITNGRYQGTDLKFQYRNRDGSISLPKRELWMVINMQGSGIKLMSLSMMIEMIDLSS